MFVQIAKGRHKKKKEEPEECEDDDSSSSKSNEDKEEQGSSFSEVKINRNDDDDDDEEIEEVGIDRVQSEVGTSKQPKEPSFLNKISEKASKLKRNSLSKIFGEKENDVKIYTIDQEMKKTRNSTNADVTHKSDFPKFLNTEFAEPKTHKFHSSELTEKLEKSRNPRSFTGQTVKHIGTQASPFPKYRLLFLPCSTWNDPEEKCQSVIRLLSCQISIASFLFIWIIFGALLFFLTEGSDEFEQRELFLGEEESVLYSLATDLRLIPSNSSVWKPTLEKYLNKHKGMLTEYLAEGYSEEGEIWTYSGSVLFCCAMINVFGYGFPWPKTIGGNIGLIIFTMFGLPLNLALLRSAGLSLAAKIQLMAKDVELHLHTLRKRIQNVRKYGDSKPRGEADWPRGVWEGEFRPPWWLPCILPIALFIWYTIGCLLLGLARLGSSASPSAVLFFPRDLIFTLPELAPFTRLSFALYLELSSLFASLVIALIEVPSPTSLIDPLIDNLVVTNSIP